MQRTHRSDGRVAALAAPEPGVPNTGTPRIMRAGDADRRRVVDLLQDHYVAGRLDSADLEGRLERALGAKSLGDLDALLADLPAAEASPRQAAAPRPGPAWSGHCAWPVSPRRGGEQPFRAHAASYLLVMALLMAIWLLTTPGGYFWPIWPALGWGIGLASHGFAAYSKTGRGGFGGLASS